MPATDFENEGGANTLAFGETSGFVRVALRVDSNGRLTLDPTSSAGVPLGNAAMAASVPVTIASDDTIPTALQTALELLDNAISGTEMQVDVVSIAAGETHLGQVGGEGITIAQTPTVTAGAYTAGDAVGGLLTFASAGRVSTGGSILTDILIVDDAGQDVEMELWLFNQTFTAIADNAAWAPSEADLENCIAVVSTENDTWRAAGTPSTINVEVTRRIDITGTSLFGQLVTRGTPTYAATDDVTVKIKLLQD